MVDFDPTAYGASGIADEYDDLYAGELETDAAVDCLTDLAGGGKVLELGIGTGRLALPLLERGIEIHGIDGSPEMVAKLRHKPGGDRIPVVIGDFASAEAGTGFSLAVLAVNTLFALAYVAAGPGALGGAQQRVGHLRQRPLEGGRVLQLRPDPELPVDRDVD